MNEVYQKLDKEIKVSSYSKTAIAKELGLTPQGLNNKLVAKKVQVEFVKSVCAIIGIDAEDILNTKESFVLDNEILIELEKKDKMIHLLREQVSNLQMQLNLSLGKLKDIELSLSMGHILSNSNLERF